VIANARMYAVTPQVEAAWSELLAHICALAGVPLDYLPYPAPQPLEPLWQREDIGAAFMCGYPIRLKIAKVKPLAAPIPSMDWAGGKAVYRTDLIVRKDSEFSCLADTFGHRLGWTVSHSHSGFNALRHHLLRYRTAQRPKLYGEVTGDLITARAVLDRVSDGRIDIGPLDAYWHHLLRQHQPEWVQNIRVIESTDVAPMPCFVASPAMADKDVAKLKNAFYKSSSMSWFTSLSEVLCISGFEDVHFDSYVLLEQWQDEALSAGYSTPA
jgi:ABC-type phosphate/phosphonate transport system substrate-binding protein